MAVILIHSFKKPKNLVKVFNFTYTKLQKYF